MRNFAWLLSTILGSTLVLGCGGDPDSGADNAEQLVPKAVESFEGHFDDAPTFSSTTDLCLLSGVSADFHYDNNVSLDLYNDKTYHGFVQAGGNGWQICSKWSNFALPDSGTIKVSKWFDIGFRGTDESKSVATLPGYAATVLASVGGELEGGGEAVGAHQIDSLTSNGWLSAETHVGTGFPFPSSAEIYVGGYAVVVTRPKPKLVRLIGFIDGAFQRGTIADAGTFSYNVSTSSGFSSYWLSPRSKGVCYLSKISGNLDGTGEGIRIIQKESQWFIKTWAKAGRSAIGQARCLAYDQR